jgi:hypothetical protein
VEAIVCSNLEIPLKSDTGVWSHELVQALSQLRKGFSGIGPNIITIRASTVLQ